MKFARAVAALLAGRATASLLYTVALLLAARWGSVAEFGRISSLIGLAIFVNYFFDLGLSSYILKNRAIVAADDAGDVLTALRITKFNAALATVVTAVLGLALHLHPIAALTIAAGSAFDKYTDTWLSVLIAEGRNGVVSRMLVERRTVLIGGVVVCHLLQIGAAVGFGVALAAAAGVAQLRRRSSLGHLSGVKKLAPREVVREGRHFWVALMTGQTKELESGVVLGVTSPHVSGLYSAGARLARPVLMLATTTANVLLPHLARRDSGYARRAAFAIGWVGIGYIAFMACLSPWTPALLELLLGHGYDAASSSASIQIIGIGPVALCSSFGSILQSQGHERLVARNGVIFAVTSMLALIAGAVTHGAMGAAVAVSSVMVLKFLTLWRHAAVELSAVGTPSFTGNEA